MPVKRVSLTRPILVLSANNHLLSANSGRQLSPWECITGGAIFVLFFPLRYARYNVPSTFCYDILISTSTPEGRFNEVKASIVLALASTMSTILL